MYKGDGYQISYKTTDAQTPKTIPRALSSFILNFKCFKSISSIADIFCTSTFK